MSELKLVASCAAEKIRTPGRRLFSLGSRHRPAQGARSPRVGHLALLCALAVGAWLALAPQAAVAQAPTPCDLKTSPSVTFSASCSSLTCTFQLSSAPPPAGSDLEWDFGDGLFQGGPSQIASHTYAGGGYYLVTLTVTQPDQQAAIATSGISLGSTAPLAMDDAFTTPSDAPLVLGIAELLSNDAPGVTFLQVTPASKCLLNAGGQTCTYTPSTQPAPGSVATDSFTYTVQDAAGHPGAATVTITVTRPLVANPDYYTLVLDPAQPSLTINGAELLANDSPGAQLVRAENWENGTLQQVQASPAMFTFTPDPGFYGLASFDYLISWDGVGPPYATGQVYIDVKPGPPSADFSVSCVNRTCTVYTNATAAQGLTIEKYFWDWGDGTPVIQPTVPYPWAAQSHTYAASGRYTITHTVVDSFGQTGSFALEALANTKPVAVNDSAATERDITLTIPVLGNDSDPDGDALTILNTDVQSLYPGALHQVVANGSSWAILLTPPDTFVGAMTFHYTMNDRWGASATATVTLAVSQWSVIVDAIGEQFYTGQGTSIRIAKGTLLANDYASAGSPLSIVDFNTSILMGVLDCTTDPTACTYTPPNGGLGQTLFRYTISDPAGRRDTATVRLYVSYANQSPTAQADYFSTTRNTAKAFTHQDIVQNDTDPEGDTLSVGLSNGAKGFGSLSCSTPFYVCTYTPNAGFVGTDRFQYTASDGLSIASTASINMLTLPPSTPAFDARENVVVTGVNQQTYFSKALLASNDYAPSGGSVTVTATDTTGLVGTLTCDTAGCTYKPPTNFAGTTSFRYTASDGQGATDTAIVKIRVGSGNGAPVAVADTLSTPKNTVLRFPVFEALRRDYDPDNDPLTVTISPFGTHLGTLSCGNPNYWCTYTPNANATGADAFNYTLSDGQTTVSSTVTINIIP